MTTLPHLLLQNGRGLLALTALTALAAAQGGSGNSLLEQLPAQIVPNQGQWASSELYRMRAGGMHLYFERTGWSFWLREQVAVAGDRAGAALRSRGGWEEPAPSGRRVGLRMTFVGAGKPTLTSERPRAGVSSYLLGDDAASHRRDVVGYGAILYDDMYPGVDVRVREAAGLCEYDLLLAPGADLGQVRVRVDGARSVGIDADGSLVLHTAFGDVRQPAPTTWAVQENGTRRAISCRYRLCGDGTFGFSAPERDASLALVVDPPMIWSSYVGGSAYDEPFIVKEDGTGKVLVAGYTESFDLPVTPGVIQPAMSGTSDGFVMLLDPSQPPANQIVFSTYFGGSGDDAISGVEFTNGVLAIAGGSTSIDLPTTPGSYQPANAGGRDVFVAVIDPFASAILSLSYFGGSTDENIYPSLHADGAGNLYLAGGTSSADLPTTPNAFDDTKGGTWDGFVAVFDSLATTLTYSTYLGGSSNEGLWAGDLDANGVMTMIAGTLSTDYPTTANAFDTTYAGGGDCVVVQFAPAAPAPLLYSSYYGSTGQDGVWGVKQTPAGLVLVSGTTEASNFPTTPGAYQTTFAGGLGSGFLGGDAFVMLFDTSASGPASLVASTYFGGSSYEQGLEADVDSTGEITLTGWVNLNSNLPTTPGAMRRTPAANDGYVARFSADLSQLLYSSYLGGSSADGAWLCDHHADGVITVFGQSQSIDVPTLNGFEMTNPGAETPWVARYSLVPDNTVRRGAPTPGSSGSPTIHATDDATLGNAQFAVACTKAPLNGVGLLAFSPATAPGAVVLGFELWVDPTLAIPLLVTADAEGESLYGLPLPATAFGTLHAQYVWIENASLLTLSASDALQIQ